MPDCPICPSEAIIICTRNRPEELNQTLQGIASQSGAEERPVLVVDGSDFEAAAATENVVDTWKDDLPFSYYQYPGQPAGTRQRNAGIDRLPSSVQVVHFLDDDIILKKGYFDAIMEGFSQQPSLLGVGGVIEEPSSPLRSPTSTLHRLFLLNTNSPNHVLPSGQTTPPCRASEQSLQSAEWLATGASSYRRQVFDKHRFDPAVEGPSPRLEDLDFSYRVAQDGPLAVATEARCIHHVSTSDRRDIVDVARDRIVRRYWFIEKNMAHPIHRLAFWWSVVGKFLARIVSSHPDCHSALRGLLVGIRVIWTREHPLLQPDDPV